MRIYALLLFLATLAIVPACRTNETPEQQVNDLEITTNIKTKLASGVALSTLPNIAVNSTNGVVTLSGMVDTAETRAKVESVARSVPHVVRVVDNIQVASSAQAR